MRKLSDRFMQSLTVGELKKIRQKAIDDPDIILEIRENYLNLYFKGKSLLKLVEAPSGKFQVNIHPKFTEGLSVPAELNQETVSNFLEVVPAIKENILKNSNPSIEIEYEQLIIRANNFEPRNNSEYFIVDRQVTAGEKGRFDLTGFYWPWLGRRRGQIVSPCLFELKAALNKDIQSLHEQIRRYYEAVFAHAEETAESIESILHQKLELGLFQQPIARLEVMKSLTISRDINQFLFILILVDYNPYSELFGRTQDKLAALPFVKQIKIFKGGFGLWEKSFERLKDD